MKANLCPVCKGKGWVEDDPIELELKWRQTQTLDLTKCPSCGSDRNSPALTGCPKGSHYGTYCLV